MPPYRDGPLSEEQAEDLRFWWTQIRPGDEVLWTGRASGVPALDPGSLFIIVAGAALVACGVIMMLSDVSSGRGQGLILISVIALSVLLHNRRCAYDDTRYALTEHFAMVWNGQVLRVWSCRPGLARKLRHGPPASILFALHPDALDDEGPRVDELGGFMGLDTIDRPLEIFALKDALSTDMRTRPPALEPKLPGDRA